MSDPGAAPLYMQISDLLVRDIAAGRLLEGERLPPEREMAASYGISVGTLRKALADLSARGMLERRQGSGNYIGQTRGAGGPYAFFRLELVEGGGQPTAQVLDVQCLPKANDMPEFGPHAEAHRIRRVRSIGGIPCVLEEIWLDATWAPEVRAEDLSDSLYHYYRSRLGLWITRAEDRVGLADAPGWDAATTLTAGAPCGFVERVSWAQTGARAEFSRTWFDHQKARYVQRIK
ncbi:GntR family transcriptional regulator [Tranquillimonas alkanivorans]|uniref:Transcriptional regulator, GntR family n=1 Tax=Tranquillimonas alkanivorans TaxID=441119 RepID=A0A1I5NXX3_9RHOB|nr:GntR family transcriptional regulator [Tranquillimonas alkanivorans]SFP26470.1 transcriptional regulator, GntR family [Tranquillimonas alkanivorans]